MNYEISQKFFFDAAHTLRREVEADSSRRIHGHTYNAEVMLSGQPAAGTGMVVDLGLLERTMEDARDALDHRFLDEIKDLGPATMENLSRWIWDRLAPEVGNLFKVTVYRDSSGEACSYWGEEISA